MDVCGGGGGGNNQYPKKNLTTNHKPNTHIYKQGGGGHDEPPHRQAALPYLLHHGCVLVVITIVADPRPFDDIIDRPTHTYPYIFIFKKRPLTYIYTYPPNNNPTQTPRDEQGTWTRARRSCSTTSAAPTSRSVFAFKRFCLLFGCDCGMGFFFLNTYVYIRIYNIYYVKRGDIPRVCTCVCPAERGARGRENSGIADVKT